MLPLSSMRSALGTLIRYDAHSMNEIYSQLNSTIRHADTLIFFNVRQKNLDEGN